MTGGVGRAIATGLLAAAAIAAAALVACGGDSGSTAPEGSPDNPLVARTAEPVGDRAGASSGGGVREPGAASGEPAPTGGAGPGYRDLVDGQSARPRSSFTPCNLVERSEARAILGEAVEQPREALQGPTCVYRSASGERFVTVAVQAAAFDGLRRRMYVRREVDVAGRSAYCGTHGQPVLYVPLAPRRVLSVAGDCAVARRFAEIAVPRLTT